MSPGVGTHSFNPSTQEAAVEGLSEFKASLVFISSCRAARASWRDPVLKYRTKAKKNLCVCAPRAQGQKKVPDALELGLLMALSLHTGAWT